MPACQHFNEARADLPSAAKSHAAGCEECVKLGQRWVHLRECLVCGHVRCCDSSIGKHATKHFHTSKHPVMRSVEPGETWGWCYVDELMVELD